MGREAVESLWRRRINIDVLMGVATVGSAALGLWEEAAFLAFLYAGAEGLEEYTYDRTRGAIRALLDLAPKEARLLRDGQEVTVPAVELRPGDRFLVRPGESLATDGTIRSGATSLDEAVVTGESVPVDKNPGDTVYAGSVNLTGAIEVEATADFTDNSLARIIHLVEEAQEEKTRTQQVIDRFGDRYSPAVLAGAFLLAVVPTLFGGEGGEWIRRAVTLTVAGAPCALVMSTPVAVAAAIGSAGKRGVLIKGGVHLENLGRVRVVCFDKTGTLTAGTPAVTDVVPVDDHRAEEVIRIGAAVEASSEHPLAEAIVRRAAADGVEVTRAPHFEALTGSGARAEVNGAVAFVGKPELFTQLGVDVKHLHDQITRLQAEGKTVVAVGTEQKIHGLLALRDEPRPKAAEAVASLKRAGIKHLAMLTGDNRATAESIAGGLGIDQVLAELRPEDKTRAIRDLEKRFGPVAMVGDGINDAPALATATVGIAMGAAGTDAAIEAADVALLGDDLGAVAFTIELGRRTRKITYQNVVFSVALLAVLVPAAVIGLIGIAVAVTAHEVAELIAVLNGLRARNPGSGGEGGSAYPSEPSST
ncbi:MAG: heavy metal translocating P-type ATPase [Acidimicrobiia bacterium]